MLEQAWQLPFSTKSDFSRAHADGVAVAASLGLITTQVGETKFGRLWTATPAGLSFLFDHKGIP